MADSWARFYPMRRRRPDDELPPPTEVPAEELRGHEVIVVTDDGDGRALRIGRRCFIDGKELLLADGASVVVETSNVDLMTITLRVLGDVRFVEEVPAELEHKEGAAPC